jgi:hypothetical protein
MTIIDLKEKVLNTHEDYAIDYLNKAGYKVRISSRDSVYYILTRDYCIDRVNLTIKDNVITKITIG